MADTASDDAAHGLAMEFGLEQRVRFIAGALGEQTDAAALNTRPAARMASEADGASSVLTIRTQFAGPSRPARELLRSTRGPRSGDPELDCPDRPKPA